MPSLEDLFGQTDRRSSKDMTAKERAVKRSVDGAMRRLKAVSREEAGVARKKKVAEKALEAARRKCPHTVTILLPGAYDSQREVCTLCHGNPK